MKKLNLLALVLLFFTFSTISAQTTLQAVYKDTLALNANYTGQIQWQVSTNNQDWSPIIGAIQSPYDYVVQVIPSYYRAQITADACEPYYSEVISVTQDMPTYYWSDNDAWQSGIKPQQGEVVTIPAGRRIILNENPPALAGIYVNGILDFSDQDLNLTTDYIMVHGTLKIGSAEDLFQHKATITLTGNSAQNIMNMGTRGIMVMGGNLELHGASPSVIKTKINAHAPQGATAAQLIEPVDWKAGDEIVMSPTDYYLAANGNSITQKLTLNTVNKNQVNFNESLNAFRWGLLQYPTATGMSLSVDSVVVPPSANEGEKTTPLVLDERAHVGHLTRNIVIQSAEDNAWTSQGFGVHIMIMGQDATAHIDGVEIKRGGQRGRLGRYPIHWHMLSYSGSQTLADVTGQYFRNSVVNQSSNRGIVIHGTNGLTVQNNVVYQVQGHGVFTEDASERRNLIDGNLVLMVRNPPFGTQLKMHEIGERGSSGFWISNPDNILTNNIAGDCATNGYWLAFTTRPWGESSSVLAEDGLLLNPSRLLFGKFDNNTAHSNGMEGINLDLVEIDDAGNVGGFQYMSTTNGRNITWPVTTLRRFILSNYKVWKNNFRGIWDRAVWADNYGAVSADNCERFFAGSGADGVIEKCLVVGTSLNHLMNGTDRPFQNFGNFANGSSAGTPVGFATYHSTFDIKDNIILNFPAVENTWSGVFSTDDYYTRPVEKGQIRNTNNLIVNSHPGVKLRAVFNYFTLASTLWDPNGNWGPANNYIVYNDTFLTYGKTITNIEPSTEVSGGVSVSGPFYGFEGFVLHGVGDTPPQNQPYMDLMGIHVRRFDNQMNEVATWTVQPAPAPDALLQHMRDFATSPDSAYELTFPQETVHPTNFQMNVENMLTTNDTQVMSIQYEGTLNPIVLLQSPGGYRLYNAVNSVEEVINSTGETFWQDKTNNRVWVKIQGGSWRFWTTNPEEALPTSDDLLYHTSVLRIYQP